MKSTGKMSKAKSFGIRSCHWHLLMLLLFTLSLGLSTLCVKAANLDAVFANLNQRNRVCLGDGMGAFTCSEVSTDVLLFTEVALGDVDGDNNLDPVFSTYQNWPGLTDLVQMGRSAATL